MPMRLRPSGHYWPYWVAVLVTAALLMFVAPLGAEERLYAETGGDSAVAGIVASPESDDAAMTDQTGYTRRVYTSEGIKDYPGTDPVIRDLLRARVLLHRAKLYLAAQDTAYATGMAEDIAAFLEGDK